MGIKMVGLEEEFYDEVVKLTEKYPLEFTSIKHFVDKAVSEKLEQLKKMEK